MPPLVSPELIAKLNTLASRLTEMGEYEAVDLIDTVVARLTPAPAEAGEGWMPIESAPKDGTVVIATDGKAVQESYFSGTAWRASSRQSELWSSPTHWRPLPAPPAALDPRQPEIRIGQFVIRPARDRIWIGRTDGEGGEFPTQHVEDVIAQFYRANF
jgi:hypothetical protein